MPDLYSIIQAYGTVPSLTSFHRPMFIGPHPDDIEFGCGGVIAKLKDSGVPVVFLIVTDGSAGSDDPSLSPEDVRLIREGESLKAASFLGVDYVEFCRLEDGGDYSVEDAIKAMMPFILKYQPDIIFAPDPKLKTECHPDHLKIGEASRRLIKLVPYREAIRRHGIVIDDGAALPSGITLAHYFTDDPNIKETITGGQFEKKIGALKCHVSQMQDPSIELMLNYFYLKAQELGREMDTGLAEDYQVIVPLFQHCFTEGIHH